MMNFVWRQALCQLFSSLAGTRKRKPIRKLQYGRMWLEELETRLAPAAFFTVPYNATLYLKPVGGTGAAVTEFGIGTSTSNAVPYFTGLPRNPNPNNEVQVGTVTPGTSLNFYEKTVFGNTYWAFSNLYTTDQASITAFADPDHDFSANGNVVAQTSATTWVLHLDDAASYLVDDNDNDVLIQVRLDPTPTNGATTTTVVTASSASVTYGAPVTLTATVAASGGSTVPTAGSVDFQDGSIDLGAIATETISGSNAVFTMVTTPTQLQVMQANGGVHTITVTYVPGTGFNGSSGTIAGGLTVTPAPLTLLAMTNTKTYDGTVTAAALPTISGLKGTDTVTGLKEVYSDASAGSSKTLSVSAYTVNDANRGNNYTVTTVTNTTGLINPAPPFFTVPYDATLYLKPVGGSAGAVTEFGIGTSIADHVAYFTGLPNNPSPNTEVQVGFVAANTDLNFYMKSVFGSTNWAFSNLYTTDPASIDSFSDPDHNFSANGNVVAQTSPTTWVLHLDDALSYKFDDDDNDVLMQIRLDPTSTNRVTTNTVVTAATASVTYGTPVTLTATVAATGGSTVPTAGSVDFQDGSIDLGAIATETISGSNAVFSLVTTPTQLQVIQANGGVHTITAVYAPGAGFIGSTGTLANGLKVTPAPLTITATTNTKTYDSTTNAAALPTVSGLVAGDTVTGLSETYANGYAPVDFSNQANFSWTGIDALPGDPSGVWLPGAPTGNVTLGGIPFNIKSNLSGYQAWSAGIAAGYGQGQESISMNVNMVGVTDVFTLINTWWGQPGPNSYASLIFNGSQGATYTKNLIGNSDIRDYNSFIHTNFINGTTTVNVFNIPSDVRGTPGALDMQHIVLPAAFATQTLTSITLVDTGAPLLQRTIIDGVTVMSANTSPGAANAGTGKTLSVSAYTVNDGNGGNNYTVTTVANTTGLINKAGLTITATPNTKTYDSTTSAAALPTVLGLLGGDTVTGLGEVYSDRNAGPGKSLSVSAYIINDGNNGGNYAVTALSNITGVINKAPLLITALTNTKIYDSTTNAAAIPTVGGLKGSDTVTGLSELYDTPNVGPGKTLSVNTIPQFSGTLTGLAGPQAMAFDGNGNLFVANTVGNTVSKFVPGSTTPSATLGGLISPTSLSFDSSGNLYVANNGANTVSKFVPGALTPSATLTGLVNPFTLAFDGSGNLFVANGVSSGTVSKFAPGGTTPSATLTGLNHPTSMAFDANGNLFVANDSGNTVSKFVPGSTTPNATLTGLNGPYALAFDGNGNLYVANNAGSTVSKFAPGATTPSATLTGLNIPIALTIDSAGNLYVTNAGSQTVCRFAPGGTTPSAILTGFAIPYALVFDGSGNLFVANYGNSTVSKFAPAFQINDGNGGKNYAVALAANTTGLIFPGTLTTTTVQTAQSLVPYGTPVTFTITVTAAPGTSGPPTGAVEVYDNSTHDLGPASLQSSSGLVSIYTLTTLPKTLNALVIGNNPPAHAITANYSPTGVFLASTGTLVGGLIVAPKPLIITATANTKTYDATITAGALPTVSGLIVGDTVTGLSEVYDSANAGSGKTLSVKISADQTPSATLTGLDLPIDLAFDSSGNLFVSNRDNNTVSKFAPGATTPSATLTGLLQPTILAFDANGNLFVANVGGGSVSKFAPGATKPSATLIGLNKPYALAFDSAGNLFVANYAGNTVSKFAPGGTTPSATLTGVNVPTALVFDASGNLYVANHGLNTVSKFAPGATTPSATLTGLNQPYALAIDGSGNLFVANLSFNTVMKFTPGSTTPSATLTGLNGPFALAFDSSGNLYVVNAGGTVSRFAPGNTTPNATFTGLNSPLGLAIDSGDNLYVANGVSVGTVSKFAPAFRINDGNGGGNYLVTTVANTAGVINKKSLTITATTSTKVYDATTTAAATPTVAGLLGTDTVSGLAEAYSDANAGFSKTLSVSAYTVNDGNGGNNYAVTTRINTTGLINKAALTITAITNTKTYDATLSAAAFPTVSGILGGDSVSGFSESYDNKNAGTGKTLSVTGYVINDGNGGKNYTVTTVANTTGLINKAVLTITAISSTKTYDSTTSAAAIPTVSGLLSGDSVTGLSESYDNKNVGTGKTLNVNTGYTVNDGNGGNNYTVATVTNSTGVINKAALTITAITNTKYLDGNTSAGATPTVAGLQGNDNVTGLAEVYSDSNLGTGKTLSVGAYTIRDGNNGNNYSVTTVINITGAIVPPVTDVSIINTQGSELEPPKGGTAIYVFTLHLANALPQAVSASYSTVNGLGATGAKAGMDFKGANNATVTIPAGVTDVPINITIFGDAPEQPNGPADKYFSVQLSWGVSTGNNLQNIIVVSATGDIQQTFGPTVSIPASQTVQISGGTYAVQVNVASTYPTAAYGLAAGPIYVTYYTSDGTAKAGINYKSASGVLTIPVGATSITIPITAIGSAAGLSFNVTLASISNNAALGSPTKGIVNVSNPGPIKAVAEVAVYRPSTGQWFVQTANGAALIATFGAPTDMPVPGDYLGLGKAQVAVYRPSTGQWLIQNPQGGIFTTTFGAPLDMPVPGDYLGLGKTQMAVFRPSTAQWFVLGPNGVQLLGTFGATNGFDTPVPGDYLGLGKTQLAVFRPSTAQWFVLGPTGGQLLGTFGATNGFDMPVPGDYLGLGKTQLAVFRPSTAQWFVLGPTGSQLFLTFGAINGFDTPAPGNYI